MKQIKKILILCSMVFVALTNIGCSSDSDTELGYTVIEGANGTKTACPTDWEIPAGKSLYPQAMFFMIDTDGVPGTMEAGDMLAAFIDGTCHGACVATTGTDNYTRCMLKVVLFMEEVERENLKVELRYYSLSQGLLFTTQPIAFSEDDIKGGYRDSYCPRWK